MVCRDFMLRVCQRNQSKTPHKVKKCTNITCNNNTCNTCNNNLCKRVHLTDDEVIKINQNIHFGTLFIKK